MAETSPKAVEWSFLIDCILSSLESVFRSIMEKKIILKLNQFETKVASTFSELRQNCEFADVTLVSEDGQEIEAHKVILSSSCPFFLNILRKNIHPHPLLVMMGVHSRDLNAIVDFLYSGQSIVENENIESFLALAKILRLTGLTRTEEVNVEEEDNGYKTDPFFAVSKREILFAKHRDHDVKETGDDTEAPTEPEDGQFVMKPEGRKVTDKPQADSEPLQLDDEINSMIGEVADGSDKCICKQCGKTGKSKGLMREHVEASHIAGFLHFCDICGDAGKTRDAVKKHKRKNHKSSQESLDLSETGNVKAEQVDDAVKSMTLYKSVRERICKVCGKEGQSTSIMRHIERNHIVTAIPNLCENCRKLFGTREALKRHKSNSQCIVNRLGRDSLTHSATIDDEKDNQLSARLSL